MSTDNLESSFHDDVQSRVDLWQPEDVVSDPHLSIGEKRRLLADWASDFRAVPDWPMLRRLDHGGVVRLSAVLAAIRELDGLEHCLAAQRHFDAAHSHQEVLTRWRKRSAWTRRKHDDDDEPPPVPLTARTPGRNLRENLSA